MTTENESKRKMARSKEKGKTKKGRRGVKTKKENKEEVRILLWSFKEGTSNMKYRNKHMKLIISYTKKIIITPLCYTFILNL